MALTYTKVNFLNNESYNEIKHSAALANGWPNFVVDGFDYDEATGTITNGRAMNGGLPIKLGRDGETQDIAVSGSNTYVTLVTVLNGISGSSNVIEMRSTNEVIDTDNLKEFPLYSLSSDGTMIEDYRHSAFIKTVEIEDLGDGNFKLIINGKKSEIFNFNFDAEDILANDPTGYGGENIQETLNNMEDKIADLTGGGLTQTVADNRYERSVYLPDHFKNDDFEGLNMAQIMNIIINFLPTELGLWNAGGWFSRTRLPNVRLALLTLVSNLFDTPELINLNDVVLRVEGPFARSIVGGIIMEISTNNGSTYYVTYDNWGDDWKISDADAFRATNVYVGQVIQEDKWDTVQKREVVMYDGGRSFIETGQSITLNKGDYLTMASFEKITLLFERFDTDAFETLGYGYKQVPQQNFTIADDGFYGTNTEIFPLSFAVDNPNTPVKAWQINSVGMLSGHSLNSDTNRGYVLVAVIGHVTEAAFKGVDATARKTKDVQFKTIPVSQIRPDVQEVIMADGGNAYDIYDMNAGQITALKTKLGILEG